MQARGAAGEILYKLYLHKMEASKQKIYFLQCTCALCKLEVGGQANDILYTVYLCKLEGQAGEILYKLYLHKVEGSKQKIYFLQCTCAS